MKSWRGPLRGGRISVLILWTLRPVFFPLKLVEAEGFSFLHQYIPFGLLARKREKKQGSRLPIEVPSLLDPSETPSIKPSGSYKSPMMAHRNGVYAGLLLGFLWTVRGRPLTSKPKYSHYVHLPIFVYLLYVRSKVSPTKNWPLRLWNVKRKVLNKPCPEQVKIQPG